jgi:hypothetical protein
MAAVSIRRTTAMGSWWRVTMNNQRDCVHIEIESLVDDSCPIEEDRYRHNPQDHYEDSCIELDEAEAMWREQNVSPI